MIRLWCSLYECFAVFYGIHSFEEFCEASNINLVFVCESVKIVVDVLRSIGNRICCTCIFLRIYSRKNIVIDIKGNINIEYPD